MFVYVCVVMCVCVCVLLLYVHMCVFCGGVFEVVVFVQYCAGGLKTTRIVVDSFVCVSDCVCICDCECVGLCV